MKIALIGLFLSITFHNSTLWACAGTGNMCGASNPCCSPNDQCIGFGSDGGQGVCVDTMEEIERLFSITTHGSSESVASTTNLSNLSNF